MSAATEHAWPGGPLRVAGSSRGVRYVCDQCRQPSIGVYRTLTGWLCDDCRAMPEPSNDLSKWGPIFSSESGQATISADAAQGIEPRGPEERLAVTR